MNELKLQIAQTIHKVRQAVRWKPESAERHLQKRKQRRHLPENATLDDYENQIRQIISSGSSQIYLYWYENVPYVTVVTSLEKNAWLVMFDLNGIMETAFVVKHPENYLHSPEYEYIGRVSEVLQP